MVNGGRVGILSNPVSYFKLDVLIPHRIGKPDQQVGGEAELEPQ
jgi:hypothetical protein